MLVATALLVAWLVWFFGARISIYEQTQQARLVAPQSEQIRIAATFPQSALGHVQPNQLAYMRLAGFSWTQYGSLSAVVEAVTPDLAQEQVDVTLRLQPGTGAGIPLQPGLAGTVEVEIEQVAPATLVLRSLGQRLAPAASVSTSQ